jgi:hypothetical protein
MKSTAIALVLFAAVPAFAHDSGESGESGKPGSGTCTDCHSGGATPTVMLTGPATLATGATGMYTFKVQGGAGVVGGLDVAASAGTMVATESDTQILSGEVTHLMPKTFASGAVSWAFSYTAPSTNGTVTLYAAGNSCNHDGTDTGDKSAATTLTVQVGTTPADMAVAADLASTGTADMSAGGGNDLAASGGGDDGGGTTSSQHDVDTGCAYGHSHSGELPLIIGCALLAFALRRRAKRA